MPVVFRWEGIRFYFFSNEGDPREPVHIHADRRALSGLVRVVEQRRTEIERAWHEHFG